MKGGGRRKKGEKKKKKKKPNGGEGRVAPTKKKKGCGGERKGFNTLYSYIVPRGIPISTRDAKIV